MFCSNCGFKLIEDAVFCDNCGDKVEAQGNREPINNYNNNYENTAKFSANDIKAEVKAKAEVEVKSETKAEAETEIKTEASQAETNNDSFSNTINMDGIKEKFKKGTEEIKNSGVFNTILNLIKSPVSTGNNIVRDFAYQEMAILTLTLLGISLLTTIITLTTVNSSYFGFDFRFLFETIFSRFVIGYIVLYIVNIIICGLITGMFMKVSNGQDVVRKGIGVAVTITAISSLISVIACVLMIVSFGLAMVVIVVGALVCMNLYFTLFRENTLTSSEAGLVLPVISFILFTLITMLISAEFMSRQAVSGILNIFNMIDMYNIF
ncbi:MAG: zinc ribbon domain-containing protein [Clostridium sp.]|uniref:zinc ribbon domain-containing protein n=1 Tax=Clostridium sp. TaxID=1506 RepID=UPI002FC60919